MSKKAKTPKGPNQAQDLERVDVWKTARLYVQDSAHSGVLSSAETQSILGAIRSRNVDALLKVLKVALPWPSLNTAERVRCFLQIEAFFKKNVMFEGPHCLVNTRNSFERAERLCRITNKRIDWFSDHPERMPQLISALLPTIKREIAAVLGSPEHWLDQIPELVRVTSGATSTRPRHKSLPHMKVLKTYRATKLGAPFILAYTKLQTGAECKVKMTTCNKVVTVSKNYQTYRTIAAEPDGLLPFQLAFDAHAKQGLQRIFGIDLSDQSKNQRLAHEGSVTGNLATVDLTMASDTLALNTVLFLFPEEWVSLLMRLRSPAYKGVFGHGIYAKFSSMGNGCTFTLETLVFASICKALCSERFSVYGDDIIIESHLYGDLLQVLKFFGFVPNTAKSFSTGLFRESCGGMYFGGTSVLPFYWRDAPRTKADECHLINGTLGVCQPEGGVWNYLLGKIDTRKLLRVPYNEDSRSGVWIHPTSAWKQGLVKHGYYDREEDQWFEDHILRYKGYTEHTVMIDKDGIQPYLLWHFYANRSRYDVELAIPPGLMRLLWAPQCCEVLGEHSVTRVPSLKTYVTKGNRIWQLPDTEVPLHLYGI